MRKVIKILSKLISTTILLLILLPLTLSVLLTIPWVQNRIIVGATTLASDFLQTRVDIQRVNIGALGFLKIEGLYLEDHQKDTLLYAERLNLHILKIGVSSREIKLGYCEIEKGELNLRQTADSILNLKVIIDRLTPEIPAPKAMVFSFENLTLSEFNVNIEMLSHRNPEYGVDYGNMQIENIEAKVDNFTIDGPTIHTSISSFSCMERSGFELYDLSGKFYLTNGVISFEQASVSSRYSHLQLPYLTLVAPSWPSYRDFIGQVEICAEVENSTLSSDDVAYFAPRMRDWGISISELDMEVEGEVDDMRVDITHSLLEEYSALALELHAKGLPDFNTAHFELEIKELVSRSSDIEHFVTTFTHKELSLSSRSSINKLAELRGRGDFTGSLSEFTAHFDASSAMGAAKSTFTMARANGGVIEGVISTEEFNLGSMVSNSNIGRISAHANIKGNLTALKESTMVQGEINRVELRGSQFHDITFGGWLTDGDFNGFVHSQNEGLDFNLSALAQLDEESPSYDLTLRVNDIDLKRLHLNSRDSISKISASVKVVGAGDNIDNSQGDVTIMDIRYIYDENVVQSENITLSTINSENSKFFELNSEYADVIYRSRNSYSESWDFLSNSLKRYLPALYNGVELEERTPQQRATSDVNNYSMLSVNIKNITPLSGALADGVQLAENSRLDMMFNPTSEDLSLAMRSQYLELNSVLALDINIDATNTLDSLAIYGSVKELLVGTRQFEDCSIVGGAAQNRVRLTAGYSDKESESSAMLSTVANLAYDPVRGRMASLRLLPSQITQGEQRWDVNAQKIEIDKNGIEINEFKIQNDEQELLVEGLASRSPSDTLRVDMHNFDLSILSSITRALGYNVEGVTNGDVIVSSALYNMRVEANITLDSVSVNELPAPPVDIRAAWDMNLNQARVSMINRERGDTLIRGYYIPSQVRYFARINIDSVHLGLLDAPLNGVLVGTTGYADANLTIDGQRRAAQLGGYIDIRDLESKVEYTNTTYKIPQARIEVSDNTLVCRNIEMFDEFNNKGLATLSVNLQHLSNINYAVRLNVEDFLALNTTQNDNDLFYGKMFTTGVIDIVGSKLGVNMDITATTRDNSEFFMPLSSKSDISTAEFITFVTPNVVDTTDFLVRKRLMFESNRRKKSAGGSNLNINMSLNVTPDADFQLVIDPTVGDVIKGRGEGRLNLKINPKANVFEMYGDYTITDGNYLFTLRNIINKRFIINPGSTIQWTGVPMDPQLDIEAIYELKTSLQPLIQDESTRSVPVECIIHLEDRLAQPTVSFGIDLPTADPEQQTIVANLLNDQESISRQFFYLMLANSFISESSGVGSDLGVSTTTSTGFELLTNQLSNWLSSSNYNVVIRYRPESELTGDELDFGISRSLINNRLLVEVEGNYSNTDSQTVSASGDDDNASNFAGEAYITWLIDRMGALKLKGFTQTIDRFDENQGLQETGIGIYYRESFDNFKDLKERVKARFSFWKKRDDDE